MYQLPTSGLQKTGIALEIVFPSIALVTTCLRIYVRITSNNTGWDDLLICCAMFLSIALAITSIATIRLMFIGIHWWDVPPDAHLETALKWAYAMGAVYNPILALVKISVLVFILRFAGVLSLVRYVIWGTIVFISTLMVAILLVVIFECRPMSKSWDYAVQGHCTDARVFLLTTGGLSIMTDVLALILPFFIVTHLRMSTRRKASLMALFGLGAIVTAFSCVRMYYLNQAFNNHDPDANYSITFTFSAIEVNLAIIGASAPALWPLIHGRLCSQSEGAPRISQVQKYMGSRSGWIRTNDAGSSNPPSDIDVDTELKNMAAKGGRTITVGKELHPGPRIHHTGIVKTTEFDLEVTRKLPTRG
ncbi:hypothetical protein F4779DRAFT_622157 [Xylariaceae sp. FL0662B]|nr:hypothetical protein F4779DRAFT_622157 [Xylariaceae sp. FL0662B]